MHAARRSGSTRHPSPWPVGGRTKDRLPAAVCEIWAWGFHAPSAPLPGRRAIRSDRGRLGRRSTFPGPSRRRPHHVEWSQLYCQRGSSPAEIPCVPTRSSNRTESRAKSGRQRRLVSRLTVRRAPLRLFNPNVVSQARQGSRSKWRSIAYVSLDVTNCTSARVAMSISLAQRLRSFDISTV